MHAAQNLQKDLSAEVDSLQQQLQDGRALAKELIKSKEELQHAKLESESAKLELEATNRALSALQLEFDQMSDLHAESIAASKHQETERTDEARGQLKELQEAFANLKQEHEQVSSKSEQYQQQLEDALSNLSGVQQDLENANNQVKNLQAQSNSGPSNPNPMLIEEIKKAKMSAKIAESARRDALKKAQQLRRVADDKIRHLQEKLLMANKRIQTLESGSQSRNQIPRWPFNDE